jgi:WD40 repeat protein
MKSILTIFAFFTVLLPICSEFRQANASTQFVSLPGHNGPVLSVVFAPDGKTLASLGIDNTIRLWQIPSGKQQLVHSGQIGSIMSCIAFSPNSRMLAYGSKDNTIKLLELFSSRERKTLQTAGAVLSVAFTQDGKKVLSGSTTGATSSWHILTGQIEETTQGHAWRVYSLTFSPDERTVASASPVKASDYSIKHWDLANGKLLLTLDGHLSDVYFVAFSPDASMVASASRDHSIKLWDVRSGKEKATLRGHNGEVISVVFSPDGKTLASAGADTTIKLWDLKTNQVTSSLEGHTKHVRSIAFSPNGKLLASAGGDGYVRIWQISSGPK